MTHALLLRSGDLDRHGNARRYEACKGDRHRHFVWLEDFQLFITLASIQRQDRQKKLAYQCWSWLRTESADEGSTLTNQSCAGQTVKEATCRSRRRPTGEE